MGCAELAPLCSLGSVITTMLVLFHSLCCAAASASHLTYTLELSSQSQLSERVTVYIGINWTNDKRYAKVTRFCPYLWT
jgi:hypothetical protein